MIIKNKLLSNSLWNFFGQILPMLIGVLVIPQLILGLGIERFGVLSIIWMLVGYFSLFDMGLSRTLTKLISERIGYEEDDIPSIMWTALFIMAGFGCIGSVIFFSFSEWMVTNLLKIPSNLFLETKEAFYIVGLIIPLVIISSGLRGVLEAYHRFNMSNYIRLFFGIWMFLAPYLLTLYITNSLAAVAIIIAIGRFIVFIMSYCFCISVNNKLKKICFNKKHIKYLLSFGGWITVTNIIGPLMVYFDRFFIGSKLDMVSVAYYTTPYDMMTKLWIIPSSIANSFFPVFSSLSKNNPAQLENLLKKGMLAVLIIIFPITQLLIIVAHDGLTIWLGEDFAKNSTAITQYIAIGIFINCIAHLPFGLLQASGHPDLTAKLHCIEFPVYVILLLWLLDKYGLEGVALAWCLRVAIDTTFVFILTAIYNVFIRPALFKMSILTSLLLIILVYTVLLDSMYFRILIFFSSNLLLWMSVLNMRIFSFKGIKHG